MSQGSIKVMPDQTITFTTKEEVDGANALYQFVLSQKQREHQYYEKQAGQPLKQKRYTANRFLKDILTQSIDAREKEKNNE